jgi:uncharacterized membrane protein
VEVIFGLGAAFTYGAGDFFGGLASKKAPAVTVVLVSQLIGALLLLAVWPLFSVGPFDATGVRWGLAAGLCGGAGVTLLYLGLAAGPMSLIAPVTALIAAIAPVVFGLVSGERPGAVALVGVVVALAAIVIVSISPDAPASPSRRGQGFRGLLAALAAGCAFGGFFIALERAPDTSGLWPLAGARVASVGLTAVVLILTRTKLGLRGAGPSVLAAGLLDVAANVLFLLATRRGLLSLVAVLTSMYPASTVLLARVVLHERLTPVRLIGLAAAAIGVALIAV